MAILPILFSLLSFALIGYQPWEGAFWPQWLAFGAWSLSILLFLKPNVAPYRSGISASLQKPEAWIVIGVTVASGMLYVDHYPFAPIGEEIRDGLLEARAMLNGAGLSPFSWGIHGGHSRIVPTTLIPFQFLFGNSILSLRIPNVLISIFEVGLLYYLLARSFSRTAGLIGALALISIPLHQYAVRTQTTILYSSCWSVIFLFTFSQFYKNLSSKSSFIVGLLSGVSFSFHAAVRPLGSFTFLLLLISTKARWSERLKFLGMYMVGVLVGFGPRIFTTSIDEVLRQKHAWKSTAGWSSLDAVWLSITELWMRYLDSLAHIASLPTSSAFNAGIPLLSSGLFILFVGGVIRSLITRAPVPLYAGAVVLFLMFTNSTLSNIIAAGHRVMPMLPMFGVLVGYGAEGLISWLGKWHHLLRVGGYAMCLSILPLTFLSFYTGELGTFNAYRWNEQWKETYKDFFVGKLIRIPQPPSRVRLYVRPEDATFLSLSHVRETLEYFHPDTTFKVRPKSLRKRVMIVDYGYRKKWPSRVHILCRPRQRFICPFDDHPIKIIERSRQLFKKVPERALRDT